MKPTQEQRRVVRNKAEELGIDSDIAFRIGINLDGEGDDLEATTSAHRLIGRAFRWKTSPEGFDFWSKQFDFYYSQKENSSDPRQITSKTKDRQRFTQGEVMQLLHYLRSELKFTSEMKTDLGKCASRYWSKATPETEDGEDAFTTFSNCRSQYKKYKQKEDTLVSLITKLKGMK
jgi:hypothetical protein